MDNEKLKSESISYNKTTMVLWIAAVIVSALVLLYSVVDYQNYKQGQQYGLAMAAAVSFISDSALIDSDDTYEKQCNDLYSALDGHAYDFTYNGKTYDTSYVRESEKKLANSFWEVMTEAGYDRYNSYSIATWFEYTSFFEYLIHTLLCDCFGPFPFIFYLILAFAVAVLWTVSSALIGMKGIVISDNAVICKNGKNKNKQIMITDIASVEVGRNSLRLCGNNFKFTVRRIKNAEKLKMAIIKEKETISSANETFLEKTNSAADEIKKFKNLLDDGIISQEEFDTKKKQLLGQ